ncbi:hypothetical protein RQP46_001591 [Phenoliferia psychrophenolica]
MSDATDSSAAALAPTSLLSLPVELLVKIARDVAPDGGRKAGHLRLVCRHLGCVVAHVTWAAIVLPTDLDGLDEISDELTHNRRGNTSFITSVRYNKPEFQLRSVVSALKALPSLRRLHLAGTDEYDGLFLPLHNVGLFTPLHNLLADWKSLDILQLDYVDLKSNLDLTSWAPNLSSLGLVGCSNIEVPFRGEFARKRNGVKRIQISVAQPATAQLGSNRALEVLIASHRAQSISVDFNPLVLSDWANQRLADHKYFSRRTEPFSFTLTGATKLFKAPVLINPGASILIRILNWVALGPLTSLTLPVFGSFWASDADFAHLSLPRVETLVLDVDPTSLDAPSKDLLISADRDLMSNYTQLARFLTITSLPKLSTLHLRGWFEETGTSTLAQTSIETLTTGAPLIYLLLGFLRTTTVKELRMENSIGHPDADEQAVFSREGEGEWTVRMAKFW